MSTLAIFFVGFIVGIFVTIFSIGISQILKDFLYHKNRLS